MPSARPATLPWQQMRWTRVQDALPRIGELVRVVVTTAQGTYPLPFDVTRTANGWRNAKHDRELAVTVTAWRKPT